MRRVRTIRHRRPACAGTRATALLRRASSSSSTRKCSSRLARPGAKLATSSWIARVSRSPFDSIPLAVGDLGPWGGSANPSCPNRTLVSKLRAPRVAKARTTRLGCLPMAKRMSLQCPLCDELVAALGRERTVAAIAQHVRIKHVELTEARRNDLAQRPWQPLPLADSLIVARPIRIEPRT